MKTRLLIIIGIIIAGVIVALTIGTTEYQSAYNQNCNSDGGYVVGFLKCIYINEDSNVPKTGSDCRMIFGKGTTEMYDCLEKIKNNILTQKPSAIEPEPEYVLDIAQEFIKSSPTFLFDGIPDTLSLELVAIRESFQNSM